MPPRLLVLLPAARSLRPAVASSSSLASPQAVAAAAALRAKQQQQQRHTTPLLRAMASSTAGGSSGAPRTFEWLVVVPDKPGVREQRLKARPEHFANMVQFRDSGKWKMGGAILEDMPEDDSVEAMHFAGSTLVVVAESREAVLDMLKGDPYIKAGVWDMDKVMIWPAKMAFRNP